MIRLMMLMLLLALPARAALMPGFMVAFGLCAALMAVAILIARGMKDQPLRSGLTPTPPAH